VYLLRLEEAIVDDVAYDLVLIIEFPLFGAQQVGSILVIGDLLKGVSQF
jgi:hypothetical protein